MHEVTMRPTGPISYLFLTRSRDRPAGPASELFHALVLAIPTAEA
jgi:hypothetical protein